MSGRAARAPRRPLSHRRRRRPPSLLVSSAFSWAGYDDDEAEAPCDGLVWCYTPECSGDGIYLDNPKKDARESSAVVIALTIICLGLSLGPVAIFALGFMCICCGQLLGECCEGERASNVPSLAWSTSDRTSPKPPGPPKQQPRQGATVRKRESVVFFFTHCARVSRSVLTLSCCAQSKESDIERLRQKIAHERGRTAISARERAEDHNNLGLKLYCKGGSSAEREAEKNYREAIRLEPKFADPYFNLGRLVEEHAEFTEEYGNYVEAEKLYRTCIALKPPFLMIAETRLKKLLAKKPRSLSQKISDSARFASSSMLNGLPSSLSTRGGGSERGSGRMRKVKEEVQPEPEPDELADEQVFTVTVPSGRPELKLYDTPGRDGARVESASGPELRAVASKATRGGKLVHGDLLVAIEDAFKVKDVSMCSARIVCLLLAPKAGNEIKLTFRGATPPNMPADVIAFRRGDPAKAELV